MTTLGELPWWWAPLIGFAIGILVFLAGFTYDRWNSRRYDRGARKLYTDTVRPADYHLLYQARKQQPECGCLVQTDANGIVCIDEPCDEHKEDDRG